MRAILTALSFLDKKEKTKKFNIPTEILKPPKKYHPHVKTRPTFKLKGDIT